jgi:GAF domain-containing protein
MGLPTTRATDPVARARLLARIREAVLSGAPAPQQPRQVVSESWRRSLAARVDPERGTGPPTIYERGEMSEIRAEHPLAETLPLLRETLVAIADEAMHMMIVTDAQGHILWREGQSDVLRRADKVGLIEGTRWSEDAIGTNAMGTAIAEDVSVQIHSAEHLVRAYHSWTCAASPVHDPDTGRIVGVVDVTGPVRSFHPSTTALVGAAAKLAEAHLRNRMQLRDEALRTRWAPQLAALRGEYGALVAPSGRVLASEPHDWLPVPRLVLPSTAGGALTLPDGREAILEPLAEGFLLRSGRPTPASTAAVPAATAVPATAVPATAATAAAAHLRLRFLGHAPTAELNGRRVRLTQRHADMLTLLALNPSGVSAEQLATGVYGERGNPVTARAEIHRLRVQLGAAVVRSGPYRLHAELVADWLTVRESLRAGQVRAAAAAYRGELRPGSEAPAVIEERELLAATLRRAVLDQGDVEAMWLLAETASGADDVELAERLSHALPPSDPRHAAMAARAEHLAR